MGGEYSLGQRTDIMSTQHSPRQFESNAVSMRLLGSEAITGPQMMTKAAQYGSTSDLRTDPFSFSAAAQPKAGGSSLKVKTLEKLKTYQRKPCVVRPKKNKK